MKKEKRYKGDYYISDLNNEEKAEIWEIYLNPTLVDVPENRFDKLKLHFRKWNKWRRRCGNSKLYKLSVLFFPFKSPTFRIYK